MCPAHLHCAPMYRVTEKPVSCGHPLSYSSTYTLSSYPHSPSCPYYSSLPHFHHTLLILPSLHHPPPTTHLSHTSLPHSIILPSPTHPATTTHPFHTSITHSITRPPLLIHHTLHHPTTHSPACHHYSSLTYSSSYLYPLSPTIYLPLDCATPHKKSQGSMNLKSIFPWPKVFSSGFIQFLTIIPVIRSCLRDQYRA